MMKKFIDLKFQHESHLIVHYVIYSVLISTILALIGIYLYRRRQKRERLRHIGEIMHQVRRNTRDNLDFYRGSQATSPIIGRRSRASSPAYHPPVQPRTIRMEEIIPETSGQETHTVWSAIAAFMDPSRSIFISTSFSFSRPRGDYCKPLTL